MATIQVGWYAINPVDGDWCVASPVSGRSSLARLEARDCTASHIGYWNGVGWEDIEPA